jgi:hypothetical protein
MASKVIKISEYSRIYNFHNFRFTLKFTDFSQDLKVGLWSSGNVTIGIFWCKMQITNTFDEGRYIVVRYLIVYFTSIDITSSSGKIHIHDVGGATIANLHVRFSCISPHDYLPYD